jgi:hypothetical protein
VLPRSRINTQIVKLKKYCIVVYMFHGIFSNTSKDDITEAYSWFSLIPKGIK